jgi:hypothetical protein
MIPVKEMRNRRSLCGGVKNWLRCSRSAFAQGGRRQKATQLLNNQRNASTPTARANSKGITALARYSAPAGTILPSPWRSATPVAIQQQPIVTICKLRRTTQGKSSKTLARWGKIGKTKMTPLGSRVSSRMPSSPSTALSSRASTRATATSRREAQAARGAAGSEHRSLPRFLRGRRSSRGRDSRGESLTPEVYDALHSRRHWRAAGSHTVTG